MKAIIMAGGKGTRLRPLTDKIPKPMVPIINKPVLETIIELLKQHSIYDIAITLGYKPDSIINYFGNGAKFGVKITYFIEKSPLGTAGGVKNCESFVDDRVLIMSGDAYTKINLTNVIHSHFKNDAKCTIACVKRSDARGFGLVNLASSGRVTGFLEKPTFEVEGIVNTGIYVMEKTFIESLPYGKLDFAKDVFPIMKNGLYGYVCNGYWSDIGTLDSYYLTNHFVAKTLYIDK